jgi:hypothetical protein
MRIWNVRRIGVQQMIQEMEKLQAKGEVGEDEMRALEMDVTGRVGALFYLIIFVVS